VPRDATVTVEESESVTDTFGAEGCVTVSLVEEEACFQHVCAVCDHVVCAHHYRFEAVTSDKQEFQMDCVLCGKGVDNVQFDFSASRAAGEQALGQPLDGQPLARHLEAQLQAPMLVLGATDEQRRSLVAGLAKQMDALNLVAVDNNGDADADEWE